MNESDAVAKANEFIHAETGVECKPCHVSFDDRRREWVIVYGNSNFFSDEIAAGAVMDGGEAFVIIDDQTGDASFMEF